MIENKGGLGKHIYSEWLFPIRDYYRSIHKNEAIFEIIVPAVCAIICSAVYLLIGKTQVALHKLSDLLPTAISILIGFTAMLITLLLTSDSESIKKLKATGTDKVLYKRRNQPKKPISLYQALHIQLSHSLFSEVLLLILIFFYFFLSGVRVNTTIACAFLAVEIYLTLNVLLSILRGITNIYFAFFCTEPQK